MLDHDLIRKFGYKTITLNDKLYIIKYKQNISQNFAVEALYGLKQKPKFISPKFFYNDVGQKLFNEICKTDEYYLTRAEIEILNNFAKQATKYIQGKFQLVELGSGDSIKTEIILDIFKKQNTLEYFPIDISDVIITNSIKLQNKYSNLYISAIVSDYQDAFNLIDYNNASDRKLVFFLGSSFGNFNYSEGQNFLNSIKKMLNVNDLFLLGLDLVKEKQTLLRAYNDSSNFTAAFNLNILTNINKLIGTNFDVDKFKHGVKYNEIEQRIEMYLRSTINQTVEHDNCLINFHKDELIMTEYSYKYTIDKIKHLIQNSNLKLKTIQCDKNKLYALILVSK